MAAASPEDRRDGLLSLGLSRERVGNTRPRRANGASGSPDRERTDRGDGSARTRADDRRGLSLRAVLSRCTQVWPLTRSSQRSCRMFRDMYGILAYGDPPRSGAAFPVARLGRLRRGCVGRPPGPLGMVHRYVGRRRRRSRGRLLILLSQRGVSARVPSARAPLCRSTGGHSAALGLDAALKEQVFTRQ